MNMKYTKEMRDFIFENYKGISNKELADRFNDEFGTQLTVEQVKNYKNRHKWDSGLTGRFEKGIIPKNKGQKMSQEAYEKMKPTMFKKGRMPKNHKHVGSERVNVDGYIEIKIAEPATWRPKHKVIWEQHYGEVPKDSVVIFLDGNRLNVTIENLKMIKRREMLIMSRSKLFQDNAELTDAATNIARLMDLQYSARKRLKGGSE